MYLACPATTSFLAICGANYHTFFVRRIKNDDDDDDTQENKYFQFLLGFESMKFLS